MEHSPTTPIKSGGTFWDNNVLQEHFKDTLCGSGLLMSSDREGAPRFQERLLPGDFSLDEKGRWATHCIRVETLQAEVNGAEVSEALIPGQLLSCSELLKCDWALHLMKPIILSLKWHYFGESTTQSIKVSRHWLPNPEKKMTVCRDEQIKAYV